MSIKELAKLFSLPLLVGSALFFYAISGVQIIIFTGIIIGSYQLLIDSFRSLLKRDWALDYIAILAIATSIYAEEYLVAGVIVLMLSGGTALEKYGTAKAKRSLSQLASRIPSQVNIWRENKIVGQKKIERVSPGEMIAVRRGEVIPLDGRLLSVSAEIDESSLTGEPYLVAKSQGTEIRSGTVNMSDILLLEVTRKDKDSTYRKIINMVQAAQSEKSPFIRLADKYSTLFTLLTLIICVVTYFLTQDITRILSILVLATPCPLILATPIALLGGVNSAAKEGIIIKNLASIEMLDRVNALIFDKTGTLTFGEPTLEQVEISNPQFDEIRVLKIAAALEMNSLHPIARSIIRLAKKRDLNIPVAQKVTEKIGFGIGAEIEGSFYLIHRSDKRSDSISLSTADSFFKPIALIAQLRFTDKIKPRAAKYLTFLTERWGLKLHLLTGDKLVRAQSLVADMHNIMTIKAECSPEDKQKYLKVLQQAGNNVAMIGDGINDAPALASANVGMAYSNDQQSAASEAADIVFLKSEVDVVPKIISISKRTIYIARQSIYIGMSLSILGMLLASVGIIAPVAGAFIQELIDVGVILNALRTSSYKSPRFR